MNQRHGSSSHDKFACATANHEMRRNQARRNNNTGGYEFFDESGETGEREKSLGVLPPPLKKVSLSSGPESAIRVLRTEKGQL